ncbi:TetR/AcrR family transcriptional regulator [Gordonia insulae]|uniref:Tetracycline repressor protein class A from transposon 1721 n=1 Tax=Gordonia insulae TaxID=2420509 RepID=A0A3G8JR00_9ACTN|nr:TetR/AcrR family transcriptional regulator [Gordonia insulae]AZG47363.1 Tetracycline repressor protein class A from transposon 1721 [Gordonia insulae]
MPRKENPPKRERRERGSIDPEEIINGAFELAEEVGVDNLSMPVLGRHLGVGVTSIYWYFRKKDDLLSAMTDRAIERYNLATALTYSSDDWRERLYEHAHAMRGAFLTNPILCDLILIRSSRGPRNAQLGASEIEHALEDLMREGLSLEDAYDSYSAVQLHVRGSVVLERLYDKNKAEDAGAQAHHGNLIITTAQTPLLAEAASKGRVGGAPDEQIFEYGLTCILDHTSRLIDEQKQTSKPAKRTRATKAPAKKSAPRTRAKSAS